jgi:Transmembrane protein 43
VVTETTTRSWGQKIGDSIKGVLFGILLFIAAFVVLWTNEGRIDISEVIANNAVSISAVDVDTENERELVSVTGTLNSAEKLGDPTFLNPGDYIKLNRSVEMWAWVERSESDTTTDVGGKETTTTTYYYETEWTSAPADSSGFKENTPEHTNPPMKYSAETFYVNDAKVGVYPVDIKTIDLPGSSPVTLESSSLVYGSKTGAKLDGGYIFIPKTPFSYYGSSSGIGNPKVGDVRISYSALSNNIDVTAFGKLEDGKLVSFTAKKSLKSDAKIYHVRSGSLEDAIESLHSEHTTKGWIFRILGFMMMWFGLGLLFGPISALLSFLPFLGKVSKTIISFVTFFMALVLSITTILVAMIAHSVVALLITIVIVLAILALIVILILKMRDKGEDTGEEAA